MLDPVGVADEGAAPGGVQPHHRHHQVGILACRLAVVGVRGQQVRLDRCSPAPMSAPRSAPRARARSRSSGRVSPGRSSSSERRNERTWRRERRIGVDGVRRCRPGRCWPPSPTRCQSLRPKTYRYGIRIRRRWPAGARSSRRDLRARRGAARSSSSRRTPPSSWSCIGPWASMVAVAADGEQQLAAGRWSRRGGASGCTGRPSGPIDRAEQGLARRPRARAPAAAGRWSPASRPPGRSRHRSPRSRSTTAAELAQQVVAQRLRVALAAQQRVHVVGRSSRCRARRPRRAAA